MLFTIFILAITFLTPFLTGFQGIKPYLYPRLAVLSTTAAHLNHWAAVIILWFPTTLGLCCARLIVSPLATKGVKRSWSPSLVPYDAFVKVLEVGLRAGVASQSPATMRTESTIAVPGSATTASFRTSRLDGESFPSYTPPVVQVLSGTDSTIAVSGSHEDGLQLTALAPPVPLPYGVTAQNESIIAVLGSAVEPDLRPLPPARRSVRRVRFTDPCHEVICGSEIQPSASAFLDEHFGPEASMEFDAFLESVAVLAEPDEEPDRFTLCPFEYMASKMPGFLLREAAGPRPRMVYPDPKTIHFGPGPKRQSFETTRRRPAVRKQSSSRAPSGRTSDPRRAIETLATPRPAPNSHLGETTASSSSDSLSMFDNDDVNFSHELSVLFCDEAHAKFDTDMAELLADCSLDQDESHLFTF